tara:strand:- start:325 stop:603 length:279 start_codon:yes stop_codon:yes gene_type:complete
MLKKIGISNLNLRKKKILFKCTHRGSKELDILLGNYVSKYIKSFSNKELDYLDVIIDFNDVDLFKILTKKMKIDKKMNSNFVNKIILFNKKN